MRALTLGTSFTASATAFTKKPIKPSRMPCFFSNKSLYLARASMTADMSTSLNVVSSAAVFCASFRRCAIVWRRRVIFTRSSWRSPAWAFATGWGAGVPAALGSAAGARASGSWTGPPCCAWAAARTSSLVRRPSLPVPLILLGSTWCSSTARRTAGESVVIASPSPLGAGSGACSVPRSCGFSPAPAGLVVASAASLAGDEAGGASAAAAVTFSSMRAMTAPTATVSPSLTSVSLSTPADGDGTSTLTLSVSSVAMGSSAATASPGFFSHCASVPSVIDSPSAGTATSVAMAVLLLGGDGRALDAAAMAKSRSNQVRLLRGVAFGQARCGRSRGLAARIDRPHAREPGVREAPLQQVLDEEPGAVVLRLFLRPDQSLELRHGPQALHQGLRRKRIELLDPDDLGTRVAVRVASVHQLVSKLAGAQYQPL